ncbi:MAG: hypothetical protein JSV61_06645 [Anaerolineales bacterium]|nr:MAG: hypothetical protein JSV61_06645 [Anaerolineales bacterium]
MNAMGINLSYLIIQVLILGVWPLLSLAALYTMQHSSFTALPQFLWTLLVLTIPIFGALAFFILKPGVKKYS